MKNRFLVFGCLCILLLPAQLLNAQALQPFVFKIKALTEALNYLGSPLKQQDLQAIATAIQRNYPESAVLATENILAKYCLFNVSINPENRVSVTKGGAKAELWQDGWRTFLIRVGNQSGTTSAFHINCEQAETVYDGGEKMYGMGATGMSKKIMPAYIADRWLAINMYIKQPMQAELSGLETEYFIVQLYSRDAGRRAARFTFNTGHTTQDIGFRGQIDVLFNCLPATKVIFKVKDQSGLTTASFIITDKQGNIYPSQAKRLAPDFFFQPQVYKGDGDKLELHEGAYHITYSRGPEYLTETRDVYIKGATQTLSFDLRRWIDPRWVRVLLRRPPYPRRRLQPL